RLAFDSGEKRLRVVTEYHAPRRLKPVELKKLAAETIGQWSDGIGEAEFLHRKKLGMDVDLYPLGAGKVLVEQVDDGKKVKAPRINALVKAIRDRNPKQAERLMASWADVNGKDRHGDSPLHLACLYGYLDLARL